MNTDEYIVLEHKNLRINLPNFDELGQSKAREFQTSVLEIVKSGHVQDVSFEMADNLTPNNLNIVTLKNLVLQIEQAGAKVEYSGLPENIHNLLAASQEKPPEEPSKKQLSQPIYLLGKATIGVFSQIRSMLHFIVDANVALINLIRGKANFPSSDLKTFVQATGPSALLIVGVVNLLLGVILAFMGAIQLQLFGAEIFVADLIAKGHTREIAPMMTGIILAGRTGAAYAAQLGTMQVNEEIDAYRTFGFSPMEFLVLPRMIALALMTPLLVLYGDAIGLFGGYLIGVNLLDLGTLEYIRQTQNAIDIWDVLLGVFKGSVFGVLVAITGCREGLESGRSASAVGDAATRAVVNGILAIIIATAFFAVLTNWLNL